MNEQGMIYIWLYALESRFKSLRRIPFDFLQRYARPFIARLPLLFQNMVVYPAALIEFLKHRKSWKSKGYKLKNSVHHKRDDWTPFYAHHESILSVIEWFQESGLEYRLLDTFKFNKILGRGMSHLGIRGIKNTDSYGSINTSLPKYIDCSDEVHLTKTAEIIAQLGKRKLALPVLKILKNNPFVESRVMKLFYQIIFQRAYAFFRYKYSDKYASYRLIELLKRRDNLELLIKKIED
jgi:hypothetical protein